MENHPWDTQGGATMTPPPSARKDNEFCAKVGITTCTDNVVSEAVGRKFINFSHRPLCFTMNNLYKVERKQEMILIRPIE